MVFAWEGARDAAVHHVLELGRERVRARKGHVLGALLPSGRLHVHGFWCILLERATCARHAWAHLGLEQVLALLLDLP